MVHRSLHRTAGWPSLRVSRCDTAGSRGAVRAVGVRRLALLALHRAGWTAPPGSAPTWKSTAPVRERRPMGRAPLLFENAAHPGEHRSHRRTPPTRKSAASTREHHLPGRAPLARDREHRSGPRAPLTLTDAEHRSNPRALLPAPGKKHRSSTRAPLNRKSTALRCPRPRPPSRPLGTAFSERRPRPRTGPDIPRIRCPATRPGSWHDSGTLSPLSETPALPRHFTTHRPTRTSTHRRKRFPSARLRRNTRATTHSGRPLPFSPCAQGVYSILPTM